MSHHAVAALYRQILEELGVDEPAFLDVKNTPARVARMLSEELLAGYRINLESLRRQLKKFPSNGIRELVVQGPIPFTSVCAHHMLPFTGTIFVGYLPGKYVAGLSKFTRIIRYHSARLQLQERLGAQIADTIFKEFEARASFVLIVAEHQCMSCRGVRVAGVSTRTTSYRPLPPNQSLLNEFYRLATLK